MGAVARLRQRRAAPVTAFVLSGGGSLGALQAGMLRALYERRIVPDMLVATSVRASHSSDHPPMCVLRKGGGCTRRMRPGSTFIGQ